MVHLAGAKMIRHTWRSWPRRSKTGAALTLHPVWKGNKSFTWKISIELQRRQKLRKRPKLLTRIGDAQKKLFFLRTQTEGIFLRSSKGWQLQSFGVQCFFGLSVSALTSRMFCRPLPIEYISCVYVCYTSKDAMYSIPK